MQEFRDHEFDAEVARKLKFAVGPRQQQNARERLLRRASAQVILPALERAEEPATLRSMAAHVGQRTLRFLHFLVLDTRIYERARRPPLYYQYYNAHGRYAFTIIHMSA